MVKERLNELVDFATKESPYSTATKGWLNEDLFIQWGPNSQENSLNKGTELINFSVFWNPISRILSLVFLSLIVSTSILCLIIFLAQGRLSMPFESTFVNENLSRDGIIQDLSEQAYIPESELSDELLDPVKSFGPSDELEPTNAPAVPASDKTSNKGLSLF